MTAREAKPITMSRKVAGSGVAVKKTPEAEVYVTPEGSARLRTPVSL
jgi:hypothetical protein